MFSFALHVKKSFVGYKTGENIELLSEYGKNKI